MSYGNKKKKIIFEDTDGRHAQLRVRLRYDGITQVQFFHTLVTAYLNKDERITNLMDELKERVARQGRAKLKEGKKLRHAGQKQLREFTLTKDEKDGIFDLIAEEFGDL